MFRRLFGPNTEKEAALALYRATAQQARAPWFFLEGGIGDNFDGRFDLLALHAALVVRRLRREGEPGKRVAQHYFDILFGELDRALREEGIGDLSVGKKIKAMVSAFYGRAKAYDAALDEGSFGSLGAALARNLFRLEREEGSDENVVRLTHYTVAALGALNAVAPKALLDGRAGFPFPESGQAIPERAA